MSFWNSLGNTFKDIGTSTVRVITDTALDIGDAVTLGRFSDTIKGAKEDMSRAGVLSAKDAIENSHYADLKGLEHEADEKRAQLTELNQKSRILAAQIDTKEARLSEMLNAIQKLLLVYGEIYELLKELSRLPGWNNSGQVNKLRKSVENIDNYSSTWENVIQSVAISKLGVGTVSGVTAIASIPRVLQALKVSRSLKVAKIAGRATIALTAVIEVLDIGLSIAELEQRKERVEHDLRELNAETQKVTEVIQKLEREIEDVEGAVEKILSVTTPPQTEASWEKWIEETDRKLKEKRDYLISEKGIFERASKMAEHTKKDYTRSERIKLVQSVDRSISWDIAESIVAGVDSLN
jgi:chaperonin cofactor prefoldin